VRDERDPDNTGNHGEADNPPQAAAAIFGFPQLPQSAGDATDSG
jgi:hypothetical protein